MNRTYWIFMMDNKILEITSHIKNVSKQKVSNEKVLRRETTQHKWRRLQAYLGEISCCQNLRAT